MGFWKQLTTWSRKNAAPDWGTLERYLAWSFGGGASAAGIIVNPQTAMQSGAVYACNKVLSESVGMLPCNLYTREGNGARNPARTHPLWSLLHDQPNDYQTSVEFFEMMVTHLNLRGNSYSYVNRASSGRVAELLPLHPDMVRTEMGADFTLRYQVTMPDGAFKYFEPGEIMHVRGLTLNGWLGISPIAYAREAIGLALATEKFGGQLFRNGAKMGGVLQHPGKLSDEAYKRIKDSFDQAHSGENAHKTALLEEGMTFGKISMTGEDAQFLETRKYQRSEIAAIFRVPPHMIGDLEKATFSNIEQQSLDFVQSSLMPWLNRIEKAIKRDLLTRDERKNMMVRFNIATLLRGDAAARSTYYKNGITDGWLTRNEARTMESELGVVLNPIDGLEIPLRQLNMTDGREEPEDPNEDKDPKEPPENEGTAAVKALGERFTDLRDTLRAIAEKPAAPISVRAGDVTVTVPEREVHVEATLPEISAPDVHVDVAAPQVHVKAYPGRSTETIDRDERGEIKSVVRENKD